MLFVLKTGIPWEELPDRIGKPNSIWKGYDRWCPVRLGASVSGDRRTRTGRRTGRSADRFDQHQSPPVASIGRRLADKKRRGQRTTLRRTTLLWLFSWRADAQSSRRDWQERTARHLSTDGRSTRRCSPLCILIGRGQLLKDFERGEVETIVVDATYDSDAIRQRARQLRARVCIKPNAGRQKKKRDNRTIYKHRNLIERFFGKIKRCRPIATRYEKNQQTSPASSASQHWSQTSSECPYDLVAGR